MRIDSTGLKVYGEGEWKVCKHDCIDLVTQEILSVELTGNDEDNARVAKRMLQDKSENLDSLKAMGV